MSGWNGGTRFEAEDGTRGFLDVSAPASAAGMLAVRGPGGLLPFDRDHGPGEWRAIRLGIKQSVLEMNIKRALRTSAELPSQVIVVGGPAGDEELLGVLARALPPAVAIGRGDVGGTLGPRYAVALGLVRSPLPAIAGVSPDGAGPLSRGRGRGRPIRPPAGTWSRPRCPGLR